MKLIIRISALFSLLILWLASCSIKDGSIFDFIKTGKPESYEEEKKTGWKEIGTFPGVAKDGIYDSTVYNGRIFVAYRDFHRSNSPTAVVHNGSSWQFLKYIEGYNIQFNSSDKGSYLNICIDNNSLYMAFIHDWMNLKIMSYDQLNDIWNMLMEPGTMYHTVSFKADQGKLNFAGLAGGQVYVYEGIGEDMMPDSISLCSLYSYAGVPYVAYLENDAMPDQSKLKVVKSDGMGSWIGIEPPDPGIVFGIDWDSFDYLSLALYSDGTNVIPVVSYLDMTSNILYVKRYNFTTHAWETLWSESQSMAMIDYDRSLAVNDADDTIYLAYTDWRYNGKATVISYNGTSWDTVGGYGGITPGKAYRIAVHIDNGTPYITYVDDNTFGSVLIMKYGN